MRADAPEILAPAGGKESLVAAVRCGADAVYLGGRHLNARRGARNFDEEALRRAVSYCHARGVKVYLALNILVFDGEMGLLAAALRSACEAGVDALLAQDLAVARLAREAAPTLPLHASTQMSIHSPDGANLLRELGFSRAVLAREMTKGEIAAVVNASDIEAEIFVHGALCMSVSGQCMLSSVIGGRSGNRGLCAQPCRLPFAHGGNAHALSLRDLSLVSRMQELKELGVASLKIEGRLKRPEYVAAAVTTCRQALAGETPDFEALTAIFSRGGFTDGYFTGERGAAMFGVRKKEDVASAASVLGKLANLYKEERQAVPLSLSLTLRRDAPASLVASDPDGNTVLAAGPVPQEARTSPTTPEKATYALGKTGGTFYTISDIKCNIDEGLILPVSALNALRREVLCEITARREAPRPHPFDAARAHFSAAPRPPVSGQELRVRLGRAGQLSGELARGADRLILPASEWEAADERLLSLYRDKLMVEIPRIIFDESYNVDKILQKVYNFGVRDAVAGNLGGLALARRLGFAPHGDYGLNIVNTPALEEYARLGLLDATLSFEVGTGRVRALGGELPRGILAYGYLPLMALRNCPAAAQKGCGACGRGFPEITDRLRNRFFLDCQCGVATLYNCVPLYLSDRLRDFPAVDFFTLYLTRESPQEALEILRRYRAGEPFPGEKTRGLYYREVL